MAEKILNSRIILKHDTVEHWGQAVNFIPRRGEIIIYEDNNNHSLVGMKVGDGETQVDILPFITESIANDEIDAICGATIVSGNEVSL